MWWTYAVLCFFLATLVSASAAVAIQTFVPDVIQDWLPDIDTTLQLYSCGSDGGCTLSPDGSFSTYDECAQYCDHAQCVIIGVDAECSHAPGSTDAPPVSECTASCGVGPTLAYVCDTSVG